MVVVGLRNLHLDGNALGVRLDVADVSDAIGTPRKPRSSSARLGSLIRTRITFTFCDVPERHKSGPQSPVAWIG